MKKTVQQPPSSAWIPVEESMPEECDGLHWYEDCLMRYTTVLCCDVNTGVMGLRNRFRQKKTGNVFLDQGFETEWIWSRNDWWQPTHWIPVPEMPPWEENH